MAKRSKKAFTKLCEELDYRCAYCGCQPRQLTRDHVFPLSRYKHAHARIDSFRNILPSCRTCNTAKGNMTIREFQRMIENKSYKTKFCRSIRQKLNKRYGEYTSFYFIGKRIFGRVVSIEWYVREFERQRWVTMGESQETLTVQV